MTTDLARPSRVRCAEPDAEPDTLLETVGRLLDKLDERSMERLAAGLIQLRRAEVEEEAPGLPPQPPPGGIAAGPPGLEEGWPSSPTTSSGPPPQPPPSGIAAGPPGLQLVQPPPPPPGGIAAGPPGLEEGRPGPPPQPPPSGDDIGAGPAPGGIAAGPEEDWPWSPPPPLGGVGAGPGAPGARVPAVPVGRASLRQMLQEASEAQAAARARQASVEAWAAAEVLAAVQGAAAAVARARTGAAREVFAARAAHAEQAARVVQLQRALQGAGARSDDRATLGADEACATSLIIRDMHPSCSRRGVMQKWLDEKGYGGKYDVLLVFADSGASRTHAVVNFTAPMFAHLFMHEMSGLLNVSRSILQGSRALREHFACVDGLAEEVSHAPPGRSLGA